MEIGRSILSTSQVVHCTWNHNKAKNEGASYQVSLRMWVYMYIYQEAPVVYATCIYANVHLHSSSRSERQFDLA